MPLFRALDTAVSGATMSRVWLDAIADNVANVNTTRPPDEEPFRALLLQVQENTSSLTRAGGGVEVGGLRETDATPQRVCRRSWCRPSTAGARDGTPPIAGQAFGSGSSYFR